MKLLPKPTIESLKQWKIFEHIPQAELEEIHEKIELRQYDHEESIIREESMGDHIFPLRRELPIGSHPKLFLTF